VEIFEFPVASPGQDGRAVASRARASVVTLIDPQAPAA